MSSSAQQRVKDECEKDLGFLAQEKSNLAEKRSQCQKAFDAQMDLLKKEEGHLASLGSKLQEKLKISSAPSEPKNGGYGESEDTGKGPNGQRKSNFYPDDQQWDQPNEASSWDQGNDNSSWDQKPGQQWGDVNEESGQNGQGNQSNGGDDYGYLTKKQREKRTTKKGDDWSNANEWGHGGETQEQSGNDWGNGGGEAQEQSGRDRGNGGQRGGSHWPGQTEDYYANPNPRKKYNNNFYDKSKKAKNTQWGNDQSMYDEPPVAVDMGFENPQSGNSGGGGDAWGDAPQPYGKQPRYRRRRRLLDLQPDGKQSRYRRRRRLLGLQPYGKQPRYRRRRRLLDLQPHRKQSRYRWRRGLFGSQPTRC